MKEFRKVTKSHGLDSRCTHQGHPECEIDRPAYANTESRQVLTF